MRRKPLAALVLAAGLCVGAQAQTTGRTASTGSASTVSGYDRDGRSWLPGTQRGYIGINVGRPEYDTGCGIGNFGCEDPQARAHLYTGGMFNDWFGVELGYVYEGSADRAGGRQRAEAGTLAAVVKLPLGAFNVYAKGGALYGRTRVSAAALSGVEGGEKRGWGSTLAVGAGFDFTPRVGVVIEGSRNEFRFPGSGGRQNVDALSGGVIFRF